MKQMERLLFEKEVATKVQGRYKTRIFDSNDNLVREQADWKPNLILDSGLEKIAHMPWANVFQFCVNGTGTAPTKVNTNSTASQSTNKVTIQSGTYTFTPDIVGKLIYWPGTNKYAKVTGYTDSANVTVAIDQSVAASSFYVYNVDQTELDVPYSMHCRYVPGEGLCGTTIVGNTLRLLRTFDFYMEFTPVLITEVGFKDQPASKELFSRVVLQEPQFLAAGQYFQISYELSITLEPGTPTTRVVDVSGWPISPSTSVGGTEMIQSLGMAVIDLSGVTVPHDQSFLCNEPFAPGTWLLGPEYGYWNRWHNGIGTPTKVYPSLSANPFAFNRNFVDYYMESDTGSYIPRLSAAIINGVTVATPLASSYNVFDIWPQQLITLSADYMVPEILTPSQWGKINPTVISSNTSFTPQMSSYLNVEMLSSVVAIDPLASTNNRVKVSLKYNTIYVDSLSSVVVGKTIIESVPDTSSMGFNAQTGSALDDDGQPMTYTQWLALSAWPELTRTSNYTTGMMFNYTSYNWLMPPYDPFVAFPNPVHKAEFPWENWTHTFSPSASAVPVVGSSVFISTASDAPAEFGTSVDRSANAVEIPLTIVPYVTGSCERLKKATFLTNLANGNGWYTIGVGPTDTSIDVNSRTSASKYNGYVYVFDEPQTKYNTHILNVFFKYSWSRDLST